MESILFLPIICEYQLFKFKLLQMIIANYTEENGISFITNNNNLRDIVSSQS